MDLEVWPLCIRFASFFNYLCLRCNTGCFLSRHVCTSHSAALLQWLDIWLWCRRIQGNKQSTTRTEAVTSCSSCFQCASRRSTDEYHTVCFENASLLQDHRHISSGTVRRHNAVAYCCIIHAHRCRLISVYSVLHSVCNSCPLPVFFPLCRCHGVCIGSVSVFASNPSYFDEMNVYSLHHHHHPTTLGLAIGHWSLMLL